MMVYEIERCYSPLNSSNIPTNTPTMMDLNSSVMIFLCIWIFALYALYFHQHLLGLDCSVCGIFFSEKYFSFVLCLKESRDLKVVFCTLIVYLFQSA